jgi:D-alanine-D-alanine ligase
VGITKAHGHAELDGGMEEAFRYARKALVEKAIEPIREIECAVLGNDDPVASIAGEIMPEGHEFYDYAAKYLDAEGARLLIPAAISDELLGRVQSMSVRAFLAIECAGMARVDFFLRGDDELWLNEINTIPGFTSISLFPTMPSEAGFSFADVCLRVVDLAIERHASRVGGHLRPTDLPR